MPAGSHWLRLLGGLAVGGIILFRLAIATATNLSHLPRATSHDCGHEVPCIAQLAAIGCDDGPAPNTGAWTSVWSLVGSQSVQRRREADRRQLTTWEHEALGPAVTQDLAYDEAEWRGVMVWKYACNEAVRIRVDAEAASEDRRALATQAELHLRRQAILGLGDGRAQVPEDTLARRHVADSFQIPVDDVVLGRDLLEDLGRCRGGTRQTAGPPVWTTFDYRPDTRFNPALFALGWDCQQSYTGLGALRASGVWLSQDPGRWPATATFATTSPRRLAPGRYLFSVMYQTRGETQGLVSASLSPVQAWTDLPPSPQMWSLFAQTLELPETTDVTPLLRLSGTGTVWFDAIALRPIAGPH